jgi:hypothetical protein
MDTGVDGDLILLDQRHVDDGRAGSQSTTVRRDLTGNPSYIQMPFCPTGALRCAEELFGRIQMK